MLKDQERFDLVAHFPSAEKARTAEGTLGGRVKQQTAVTFGTASWVGLVAGIVLGVAVGLLLYRNPPVFGSLPQVVSQRGILATALWAAILGASGWIIGTSISLFSSAPGTDRFELHVKVRAEKLAETRRLLIAEGATTIRVNEAGTLDDEDRAPERGHTAGTFQNHTT